jgi:hypothetical protein
LELDVAYVSYIEGPQGQCTTPIKSVGARRANPRLFACWLLASVSLCLNGCVEVRRRDAPAATAVAVIPTYPSAIRWFGENRRDFEERSGRLLGKACSSAQGAPLNVLALSGGGAGGAFGAGALVGWTRHGTRPTFQVVTGVSAGALIAPFAFLGPDWDAEMTDAFTHSGIKQLRGLHRHWLRLLFGVSAFRGEALAELVDRYTTVRMVNALAQESRKGRLLLVATTDLDAEETVYWNVGLIAEQAGESARRLIRDVLLASASVPGAFPPVMVRVQQSGKLFDEMHVDGAAAAPIFFIPQVASILPHRLECLRGGNVYLMVNGTLRVPEVTVALRAFPVLKRAVESKFQSGVQAAIEIAYGFAQRNAMSIVVTEIPNDYAFGGPLDFRAARVKALFEFGTQCAIEDRLWSDPLQALDQAANEMVAPTASGSPSCPGFATPAGLD